jgi:hypothetical protein
MSEIEKDRGKSFRNKWRTYVRLWWEKFCVEDIIPFDTIILWGTVSHETYKSYSFYLRKEPTINIKQDVYFYLRKTGHDQFVVFFFVDTLDLRFQLSFSAPASVGTMPGNISPLPRSVSDEQINDVDLEFIRALFENNVNINHLFRHRYSMNCWEVLKEEIVKL